MFDTSEYYGGCYDSLMEYEEDNNSFDEENYFDGDYIDYVYDSYRDEMLLREMEENDNE